MWFDNDEDEDTNIVPPESEGGPEAGDYSKDEELGIPTGDQTLPPGSL